MSTVKPQLLLTALTAILILFVNGRSAAPAFIISFIGQVDAISKRKRINNVHLEHLLRYFSYETRHKQL